MTDTDTLKLAAEARARGLHLYNRDADIYFSPDEVERSVWQGEDWAITAPLELALHPSMRLVTLIDNRGDDDMTATMFCDLLLCWGCFVLIVVPAAILLGNHDPAVLGRLLGEVWR